MTQDTNNQEWWMEEWKDYKEKNNWCQECAWEDPELLAFISKVSQQSREDALKECIAILEMNLDTGDGKIYSSSEPQYKNRTLIELLKSKLFPNQ